MCCHHPSYNARQTLLVASNAIALDPKLMKITEGKFFISLLPLQPPVAIKKPYRGCEDNSWQCGMGCRGEQEKGNLWTSLTTHIRIQAIVLMVGRAADVCCCLLLLVAQANGTYDQNLEDQEILQRSTWYGIGATAERRALETSIPCKFMLWIILREFFWTGEDGVKVKGNKIKCTEINKMVRASARKSDVWSQVL